MMGKYKSKGKPYANIELKGGGGGTKKKFGGSATLQAKKDKAKIKLSLGGGFSKNRPIEGIDIKEGGLSKGLDLTVPIGPTDFSIGASESREKFQAKTPYGRFKNKSKPVRNFRTGVSVPLGTGRLGLTGDVTPRGPNRKRKIAGRLSFTSNFNKGGKVSKKNKKK